MYIFLAYNEKNCIKIEQIFILGGIFIGPSMILQIIAIIILLMLSAYFSSAETALTTVNPHSMRAMAEDGNKKCCYCFKN